jgi:4-hydroxybenzoate polyprenyltransferase
MNTSISAPASSQPGAIRNLAVIAADIKIAHSVFAMPFALLAAFMALPKTFRPDPQIQALRQHATINEFSVGVIDWPIAIRELLLVVLAMICARTVAMLANRLIDAQIDRANPRTAGRALPSGRVSIRAAVLTLITFALAFILVCAGFGWWFDNWWPLTLAIPVLLWISAYGYLKRVTWLCHLYLGSSLAISPIAATIAIDPTALELPVLLLSAMVLCWVAGFDIIYALQDLDADRAQNLYSIPARLGVPVALWISRGLHGAALACLVACWTIDARMHVWFGIGVIIVAVLLLCEHLTVSRWGTSRIALAFFTLNGIISCVVGGLGILDVLF